MTKEKGFLPVGQITIGMHILRADGTYGIVTNWKLVPGTKVMYNLEVAQDHTFTVGTEQWVVHNCGDTLPAQAQARADEIGNAIDSQIGSWNRSALTVGVSIVEDGGELRTWITTNEGASSSLVKLVRAQLQDGEAFVSLADKQGRHAEEVLVQYAKEQGLLQQIKGLGASNGFCNDRCGPMLIQELGQDLLGQPWPRP